MAKVPHNLPPLNINTEDVLPILKSRPSPNKFIRRNSRRTSMTSTPETPDSLTGPFMPQYGLFPADRMNQLLMSMGEQVPKPAPEETEYMETLNLYFPIFFKIWTQHEKFSFLAMKGCLYILDGCLEASEMFPELFKRLVQLSGPALVDFLAQAVPYFIDSEMLYGHTTIDQLLTNLTIAAVQGEENYLYGFIQAVPYFSGFYLGEHTKRFEQLYAYIQTNHTRKYEESTKTRSVTITPHYLTCMHFPSRKIIVSNAPPVKLRKSSIHRQFGKFSCEMSPGGLVSGIKPSLDQSDVWVSYLDPSLIGLDRMPQDMPGKIFKESFRIPPLYRRSPSLSGTSASSDDDDMFFKLQDFLWEKTENDFLGLQRRLDVFAERNFNVNPLVILKGDHTAFYNGISNGLFWPAFHNLPQYIIDDYKGDRKGTVLANDWIKYIKVNFHFAIHTARSCRTQDFVWIHDYHLFLVGLILRCMDPTLNCGFFLHIPFGLTDEFMKQYPDQGIAVLRGLLGFKQVGFQTSRDCHNFIKLIKCYLPETKIEEKAFWRQNVGFLLIHGHWLTDVGAFPISVKIESIVNIATNEATAIRAAMIRERVLGSCLESDKSKCRFFFSVERFDYTKGIIERLQAIRQYFRDYPDRIGKDVFYQIAASSRTDVSAYKRYQATALYLVNEINEEFSLKAAAAGEGADRWIPVVTDQRNNQQEEVIALYKACDVIIVTPVADGMNLVIKEAVLSNPAAVLILSVGAGAERQFYDAGLSYCYLRVEDINDRKEFARILFESTQVQKNQIIERGQRMSDFVKRHDIGHWISSFTDTQWTQNVIHRSASLTNNPSLLLSVLNELQQRRRLMVKYLNVARHIGDSDGLSLKNVLNEVKHHQNKEGDVEIPQESPKPPAVFRSEHIIRSLELDLNFMQGIEKFNIDVDIFVNQFAEISGLEEDEFASQLTVLESFLKKVGQADVMLVSYEDILLTPAAIIIPERARGVKSYMAYLQSMTTAFLLNRYGARYAEEVVIYSGISKKTLHKVSCFPKGYMPEIFSRTIMDRNDKSVVQGKKVSLFGCPDTCSDFINWLKPLVSSLYVFPIQKQIEHSSNVFMPVQSGIISAPEVFYAAMVKGIIKPMTMNI